MAGIEHVVTSGTFSLDGGTWEVDNNRNVEFLQFSLGTHATELQDLRGVEDTS